MSNWYDTLAGMLRQKQEARIATWRELVRSIATGQEPAADDVDRILQGSGKDLDQLKTEVETYQRRVALRDKLDLVPALEAEKVELEAKVAKDNAQLAQAQQRHREAVAGPLNRLRQITEQESAAFDAKMKLLESCPAELKGRMEKLRRRRVEADEQAKKLREMSDGAKGEAKHLLSVDEGRPNGMHADLIAQQNRAAENYRQQLASFEGELPDFNRQEEEILAEMLQP